MRYGDPRIAELFSFFTQFLNLSHFGLEYSSSSLLLYLGVSPEKVAWVSGWHFLFCQSTVKSTISASRRMRNSGRRSREKERRSSSNGNATDDDEGEDEDDDDAAEGPSSGAIPPAVAVVEAMVKRKVLGVNQS